MEVLLSGAMAAAILAIPFVFVYLEENYVDKDSRTDELE